MNLRPLMIVPPIAIAIGVFITMNRGAPDTGGAPEERAVAVRVQTIEPTEVIGTAIGYGRAEAVRNWSAVAEVQGRITFMHEGHAVGSIVDEGTVLIEIDTTDYELARKKALANIAAVEAQIAELEQEEANSIAMLEVEERILGVAEDEFDRIESLVERGASSQSVLDGSRRAMLAQTVSVASLRNAISLFPSKRQSLEATMSLRQSEIAEAERSIEKAKIVAPFRGRVSEANVEAGQYVRVGDRLMSVDDVSAVEITAEVQPSEFGPMISLAFKGELEPDENIDTSQAVTLLTRAGVTAEVAMAQSGFQATWPAELVRTRGTLDADTGALGVVVRVNDPLVSVRPINRPPLNSGTFVAVRFTTGPRAGVIVIPRTAVRYDDDGVPFVYTADNENRLTVTRIKAGPVLGADVVIQEGLSGGETLVLSLPRPPVPGMKLALISQEDVQND
ncbi:HlyD family efflux transporter periplasmic adaptor subunit [Shimia thalassica]|uniref:efflux RND transporter periplasmic adaptor subunit n=1 Tax=Shimia thalassica TaxID=1715693 RepID=UPI002735B48E|nr:HlyD family efflux transporter periplasmic adaptor subunit [Shimia thalassica]MDP2578348.1 HlyD family efflux transporter periplasmic adaptor subunit [Shimia thalassica]